MQGNNIVNIAYLAVALRVNCIVCRGSCLVLLIILYQQQLPVTTVSLNVTRMRHRDYRQVPY